MEHFSPLSQTSPLVALSAPIIARAISVRPAPTNPAIPSTSPLRTEKETLSKIFFSLTTRVRFLTSNITSPMVLFRFGNSSFISRPTISRISWGMLYSLLQGCVVMYLPSRNTVTRSTISSNSSRR